MFLYGQILFPCVCVCAYLHDLSEREVVCRLADYFVLWVWVCVWTDTSVVLHLCCSARRPLCLATIHWAMLSPVAVASGRVNTLIHAASGHVNTLSHAASGHVNTLGHALVSSHHSN